MWNYEPPGVTPLPLAIYLPNLALSQFKAPSKRPPPSAKGGTKCGSQVETSPATRSYPECNKNSVQFRIGGDQKRATVVYSSHPAGLLRRSHIDRMLLWQLANHCRYITLTPRAPYLQTTHSSKFSFLIACLFKILK